MRARKVAIVAAIAAMLTACGGASKDPETGSMQVGVGASAMTLGASGAIDISGPFGYHHSESGMLPLNVNEHPCPVGNYTWTATATGSGGAKFAGSGSFTVSPGQMTKVDAFLLQQTNAVPMAVIAPYTKQISFELPGPGSGGWGVPLKLTADVTLSDNDNPDLDWFIYTWKHSCNGEPATMLGFFLPLDIIYYDDRGHMKNAAKVSTTFTSFCEGIETITFESVNTNNLLCPDKGCSLTSTVSFQIPYDPQGVVGDVTVNFAPVVSCDYVENAEPLPGGTVALSAIASDPDRDGLTYSWTDSCGGSFLGGDTLAPTWTAPSSNCTQCVLKLTVTDARNGVNTGSVTLKTAPANLAAGCGM